MTEFWRSYTECDSEPFTQDLAIKTLIDIYWQWHISKHEYRPPVVIVPPNLHDPSPTPS